MTNKINFLPISEEMLGAYLEGTLSEHERIKIETLLYENPEFKEFIDDVQSDDIDYSESIYDYYPNIEKEFVLPDIPGYEESDEIESTNDDFIEVYVDDDNYSSEDTEPNLFQDDTFDDYDLDINVFDDIID